MGVDTNLTSLWIRKTENINIGGFPIEIKTKKEDILLFLAKKFPNCNKFEKWYKKIRILVLQKICL